MANEKGARVREEWQIGYEAGWHAAESKFATQAPGLGAGPGAVRLRIGELRRAALLKD